MQNLVAGDSQILNVVFRSDMRQTPVRGGVVGVHDLAQRRDDGRLGHAEGPGDLFGRVALPAQDPDLFGHGVVGHGP
jgi:hypothetical protein